MLTDWIHWLSSLNPDLLLAFLVGILLTDVPRYALGKILMCLWDCGRGCWNVLRGVPRAEAFAYCPSVCVIIAGCNESETIEAGLESLWGTYPRLEIIVVNDGSMDNMAEVARRFARTHPGILVLSRPQRGGKSSAMNFALPYTQAEVIVCMDADSHLGQSAIWEIVQPLQHPRVGAVSATVLARNPFTNLTTWLQAYEYLSSIFVGRLLSARLGMLGIASGAFAAFRRSALNQGMGWDAGSGEDLDLTLRIRKSGYKIAFAPYAECYTELPVTWRQLARQRHRWEADGSIRHFCRKHIDVAHLLSRNFRFRDFGVWLENVFFNVFCMYGIWVWIGWFCLQANPDAWKVVFSLYVLYTGFELLQVPAVLYYSNHLARDALISAIFFLMPLYQLFLLGVRLVATTREIVWRKSHDDNYVPVHVREATWRW